jgi:TRAP-type C4-dicarboxylate transport system permease small subunit
MKSARDPIRRISTVAMLCGGALVLGIAALLTLEIVLRQGFGVSLPGVDEVSGYALAVAATWSFGYALLEKAHIRIDTVYERFARPVRAWLDLLGLLALGFFIAALAWYGSGTFMSSVSFGASSQSALQVPLAVPQGLWLAGLLWFLLVIAWLAARCARALARRDAETVLRLAGMTSTQEQLEQELENAEARRTRGGQAP